MISPSISIVIVSYNTEQELKSCLLSIFEKTSVINFEVIVIDNNSSDKSCEMIRKNFTKVKLIENKINAGFAKALNQGLKIAKGDYFLILNPDTEIKNEAILKLLNFAKNKTELAAVGPKLINSDGTNQSSCYNLPSIKNAVLEFWFGKKGSYEKFYPNSVKPIEVEAIVGAAMLIPKKSMDKIGLFNESYFLYFEDLDWCRKAKKLGLKIYWDPNGEIIHVHGASSIQNKSKSQKMLIESSKIYNGKTKYFILTLIIRLGQIFNNAKN
jgi:GT2 family glycosyltransferase